MVALADPAALVELVHPAGDPTHRRIRALLAAAYDFPAAVVHDVTAVRVVSYRCQQPVLAPAVTKGTWTTTSPGYARTDLYSENDANGALRWMDMLVDLAVDVVLEVDASEIASVTLGDIGAYSTLDEFAAKFRYFDLPAFLAAHRITTVDELKRAGTYLRADLRLKPRPPFDPADPANTRRLPLRLALLPRDPVDIAAVLRDARLAVRAADRAIPHTPAGGDHRVADPRGALVPATLFPDNAVPPGTTPEKLAQFFAGQHVAAFVYTP
ncbi:hypothetical protein GCM10027089_04830 [Nocardia thraciensis]